MKKGLVLGVIAAFMSCSDGDLVFEALNFKDAKVVKCDQNELYFKMNGHELLLIDLTGPNDTPILNSSLPLGQMDSIPTSSLNRIIYRSYDQKIDANVVCGKIPPAFPKVNEEYVSADGGYIKFMRTMEVKTFEGVPNRFDISYSYVFNFKNIVLNNGSATIKYEKYNFGTYEPVAQNGNATENSTIEFNFSTLTSCNNQLVYGTGNNKMIQIQLIQDLPTTNGSYTFPLNAQQFVIYKSKQANLGTVDFCNTNETNGFNEVWKTNSGTLQVVVSDFQQNNQSYKLYTYSIIEGTFAKANKTLSVTQLPLGKLQK